MKKYIIIPDSFKGTMSATEVCNAVREGVDSVFPSTQAIAVPVADGGEGTVDCFLYALDGEKVNVETTGPFGEKITVYYARFGNRAVMEMACCAGLPLAEGKLNPVNATTYGMGSLIRHAVSSGCTEIVIGLGGSCTNDGGTGMARALGTKFYDENGNEFSPRSDEFERISSIDNSKTEELLRGVDIIAMCDIDNPLCGKFGAAVMFAPQKGASAETVAVLDKNLAALAAAVKKSLGKEVAEIAGAGAAGGMGAGVTAFLGGKLKRGIETVLDIVQFDSMLDGADIVFTGEGRIDAQSFHGKVISGIANRTKKAGVPLVVLAGDIGDDIPEDIYEKGIAAVFPINRKALPYKEIRQFSPNYLKKTAADIARLYKAAENAKR